MAHMISYVHREFARITSLNGPGDGVWGVVHLGFRVKGLGYRKPNRPSGLCFSSFRNSSFVVFTGAGGTSAVPSVRTHTSEARILGSKHAS